MTRLTPFLFARRTALALIVCTAAAPFAASTAFAQSGSFPDKPITFVVPFAAGSATDSLARAIGLGVAAKGGQPVVVDNKAGASGQIAAQQVAKAAADGYTVLITTNTTHAANEHLYKKLSYDPVKDFVPLSGLGKGGQILVVRADAPFKSVADVLDAARQAPGKLSFGSGSSSSRVAGELFQQMAGVQLLHVPYRSNPMAITDLLGGQITLMFTDASTGVPQISAGKLRALGVTSQRRMAVLPEVPTIDASGVKGYDMGYWFAAYAPAGTPAPVVARLNALIVDALKGAPVQQFFATSGGEVFPTTPDELARFQAAETAKWGRVIKAAGIEPE
ncbi:MAG: tripartite tricarboxylate transporter substrate binding protein [Hydrogenophaga sp.]|uniref:Bug family tripartite tricarboxylate transporter substrate binding protein n=1 Tax=Hydrogenophaga sp. TaxID=1904254 RepID=UPI001D2B3127|nr:tripartite tricarboxylate transporter substrate binding protein [Hydrogenophaga sp.]MBX3609949.1 tripartite tricarboxylate transporter substrate binding protein [Hydrogenophaga sp.]